MAIELMTGVITWFIKDKNKILELKSFANKILDWEDISKIDTEGYDLDTLIKSFKFMDEFISPMSMRYWTKVSSFNLDWILRDSKKQVQIVLIY